MTSAFNARRHRRRPTINITSLIDVMFLLLIFFMISSTFREHLGIDVSLPEAATAANQEMTSHEITITREGEFFFGEKLVDEAGLREAIAALLKSDPEAALVLRADQAADFGWVVRAIDIARQVGGAKLIIPTRQRPEEEGLGEQ
ncbi:MAG: biopolymer transporter ExbD [Candidatus Hydrogenedentes bacterium]|nr:biopolymer transporter ExbD [Candidatus Hydrogenedentota bacterium]